MRCITEFIPDDDGYAAAIDADDLRDVERQMTREQYRELWRRVRHMRRSMTTPDTFYAIAERAIYNEMVQTRGWLKLGGYAQTFKAHNTLAHLAKIRREMEAGTAIGGGAGGYRIEFVEKEIKVWRAAKQEAA
jgi:hypothetical protein